RPCQAERTGHAAVRRRAARADYPPTSHGELSAVGDWRCRWHRSGVRCQPVPAGSAGRAERPELAESDDDARSQPDAGSAGPRVRHTADGLDGDDLRPAAGPASDAHRSDFDDEADYRHTGLLTRPFRNRQGDGERSARTFDAAPDWRGPVY